MNEYADLVEDPQLRSRILNMILAEYGERAKCCKDCFVIPAPKSALASRRPSMSASMPYCVSIVNRSRFSVNGVRLSAVSVPRTRTGSFRLSS